MPLDYWNGCVNFRDVAMSVNLVADKELLIEGQLFRGGKIDYVKTAEDVGNPASVINLRRGQDYSVIEADYYHFPIPNTNEVYITSDKMVRRWLNEIVGLLVDDELHWPVLVHCTSGKDRTGVVVAAILKIIGIPDEVIVQEYLLSEGDISEERTRGALAGLGDIESYFNRVSDPGVIRKRLLKP